MKLTKKGIETKDWVPPAFPGAEGHYEYEYFRPTMAHELFRFWHQNLEGIDDDYTLGDLIDLLHGLDEVTVLILSSMCHLSLKAFLEEAKKPATEKYTDIEFLEVTNVCELSTYEKDPNNPDTMLEWLSDEEAEEEEAKETAIAEVTQEAYGYFRLYW
jgi:hypothetical protein